MILSKTLNPDRFGGHSLAELSKKAGGDVKIDFRKTFLKLKDLKHLQQICCITVFTITKLTPQCSVI